MTKRVLVACFLLQLVVNTARSAAQDTDAFRAWLERETRATSDAGIPANIVVTYEILTPGRLTPDELATLRTEVEGKPDHTKRPMLEAELRRQASGPDRARVQVWWASSGYWRQNTDTLGALAALKYHDTAVTPGVSWRMVPEQLTVVETRHGAPRGYDLPGTEPGIRSQVGDLLRGGLPTAAQNGRSVRRADLRGERWSVTIGDDNLEYEFTGRWSQEHAHGLVESSRIVRASNPMFVGWTTAFEEWTRVQAADTWACRRVIRRLADGTIDTELRLLDVRKTEEGEIERVTRLPAHDGVDPIRGPVTFGKVFDFRPEVNRATYPGEPGRASTPLVTNQSSIRYQAVGWATAAGILVLLIVLRVRRAAHDGNRRAPIAQGGSHES